jgi:hypothetical protein
LGASCGLHLKEVDVDHASTEAFLRKVGVHPGYRYETEIRGRVRQCVFSRIGATGWMICHEVGEPDMQSSWAISPREFADKVLGRTVLDEIIDATE